jgi:hypothetical protein
MGRLTKALKKLAAKAREVPLISRPDDGLPDEETRDRYLKSLRRQKRRIMDREEKEQLKKFIREDEKKQTSKIFDDKGILGRSKKKTNKKIGYLGKGKI